MTIPAIIQDRPDGKSEPAVRGKRAAPPAHTDDRACPPEETLERVRQYFPRLGITRVGLVTGLDRIGIPIGFATRPNGFSLSVHQGKGLTDAAAMTSAAMEAVEVAASERAGDDAESIAPSRLAGGAAMPDLRRLTRCRIGRLDPDRPIPFSDAVDIAGNRAVRVPTALVSIDHREIATDDPFDRSSDGLASGNTRDEAILHGLLELIERDAVALSRTLSTEALARCGRPVHAFACPDLDRVSARLEAAGVALALFDITADLGIPVMAAVLAPDGMGERPDLTASSVTAGYACHFDPAAAAVKAVTEACQARVTAVAGARDDIGLDWYRRADAGAVAGFAALFDMAPVTALSRQIDAAGIAACPPDAARRIGIAIEKLSEGRMREVVAVDIATGIPGINVVRMLVPGLEIGPGPGGRHIGRRLLARMIGRAT